VSRAEFAVFAPAVAGPGRVEFDVIALQFAELRDPSPVFAQALVGPFGPVRCRRLEVLAERCAYHAVESGTALEDRFPRTWRCRAEVEGTLRLDATSDGPFDVEGWEPQFADEAGSSRGWPGWPADVTVVGGFPDADRATMDNARSALEGAGGPGRLSVMRTGAGVDLVRLRLRVEGPESVDEVVGPVEDALAAAGAAVRRGQHVAIVLSRRGPAGR